MFSARFVMAGLVALGAATLTSACAPDAASQSQGQRPAAGPPATAQTVPASPGAPEAGGVRTVRIPVEGMSCVACAARIKKTLRAMDGVSDVEVHLGERHARVQFDAARVTSEHLVATINDMGYSAGTPVPAPR